MTRCAPWRGRRRPTHLAAGLPHISGDYAGEHWLASFALLALESSAESCDKDD